MAEPRSVGERLRYVRTQRGLSLEALADQSGVSKSFLWGVENDKSGISGERLLQVAKCSGCILGLPVERGTDPWDGAASVDRDSQGLE